MTTKPKPFRVGNIKVRPMSSKSRGDCWRWRVEYYLKENGGRMTTKSLGWMSQVDAMKSAAKMVADGVSESGFKDKDEDKFQFVGDLLEAWMDFQRNRPESMCSWKSVSARQGSVKRLVGSADSPKLRDVRLKDLSKRSVLEAYVGVSLAEGRSPNTLDGDIKCLRQAIKWAYEYEYISLRVSDVPRPPMPETPNMDNGVGYVYNRWMPDAQDCEAVYQHMMSSDVVAPEKRQRVGLAFLLMWYTGARSGAVYSLTWDNIDFDSKTIHFGVHGNKVKGNKSRVVPFPPGMAGDRLCVELLKAKSDWDKSDKGQPFGSSYIFFSNGWNKRFPLYPSNHIRMNSYIAECCGDLGINRFTPHRLRMLAVNTMIKNKVDLSVACAITGHSKAVMLRYYRKVTSSEIALGMAQARLGDISVDQAES